MIARLILFISQFKLLNGKTWNVICGNYEYIIQLHGKASRFHSSVEIGNAQYASWKTCLEIEFISKQFPN